MYHHLKHSLTDNTLVTYSIPTSDVHGSAQSCKLAEAEPKIAGPQQAVVPAFEGYSSGSILQKP